MSKIIGQKEDGYKVVVAETKPNEWRHLNSVRRRTGSLGNKLEWSTTCVLTSAQQPKEHELQQCYPRSLLQCDLRPLPRTVPVVFQSYLRSWGRLVPGDRFTHTYAHGHACVHTHTQRQTWLGPYNVLLSCQSMKTPKKKFLKDRINKLETNGKNKNIRDLHKGINDFKKSYQPITNLVRDENGDLLADSHSTQNR
jgi:hypothetical protein